MIAKHWQCFKYYIQWDVTSGIINALQAAGVEIIKIRILDTTDNLRSYVYNK